MDTMIERKPGMKRKHYYAVAGAVVLVGSEMCIRDSL